MSDDNPWILYGRPHTGSAPIEAALILQEIPHVLIDVPKDPASAEHLALLAINPLGQVPALVAGDGTIMTESAAMLILLGDISRPGVMAPTIGDRARPAWLRAMVFLATNIYNDYLIYYYSERYCGTGGSPAATADAALARLNRGWRDFDAMYTARRADAIVGVLELYVATLAAWYPGPDKLAERHGAIKAITGRIAADPVTAQIWRRHGLWPCS